ncbi:MAG: hypothetical protein VX231_04415 [Pseudomonadota bacterium]|nr:hypothetical protein [Pseudomonadota bacterium]
MALSIIFISIFTIYYITLDTEPKLSSFESITLNDIKRVKDIAQQLTGNMQKESSEQQIILSERDINLAIGHFGPSFFEIPDSVYAKINLSSLRQNLQLTMPVDYLLTLGKTQLEERYNNLLTWLSDRTSHLLKNKWVNIEWDIATDNMAEKGYWLSPGQLRIGKLTLSQTQSNQIAQRIMKSLLSNNDSEPVREAWKNITNINHEDDRVVINYVFPSSGTSSLRSYQSLILTPREQVQVDIYSQKINTLPRKTPLIRLLAAMFTLAAERTADFGDPISENRALLLSLAKLYGADDLNAILRGNNQTKFNRKRLDYTIYGRRDLAKHLILSAGISLLADEDLANLIGLDKEISDYQAGKTISAWDLLADQAGIRLADNATRSEQSARQVQRLLSDAKSDKDLLPDLGPDFSYAKDQFEVDDLDELNQLTSLILDELIIFKK